MLALSQTLKNIGKMLLNVMITALSRPLPRHSCHAPAPRSIFKSSIHTKLLPDYQTLHGFRYPAILFMFVPDVLVSTLRLAFWSYRSACSLSDYVLPFCPW